jgi:hypothetical protein
MVRPRKKQDKEFGAHSDEVERVAPKKLVLSLIQMSNETRTRMQSEAGSLGEEIKAAVEEKHLHAAALKLVARLSRMDEIKRSAFLANFELYRDYAQEGGFFGSEHVGDLLDGEASEAQSLGNVAEDNVRKLRDGIRQAESAAE